MFPFRKWQRFGKLRFALDKAPTPGCRYVVVHGKGKKRGLLSCHRSRKAARDAYRKFSDERNLLGMLMRSTSGGKWPDLAVYDIDTGKKVTVSAARRNPTRGR